MDFFQLSKLDSHMLGTCHNPHRALGHMTSSESRVFGGPGEEHGVNRLVVRVGWLLRRRAIAAPQPGMHAAFCSSKFVELDRVGPRHEDGRFI